MTELERADGRIALLRSKLDSLGVCMACVEGAPEPWGCTDCLNTGWSQGLDPFEENRQLTNVLRQYRLGRPHPEQQFRQGATAFICRADDDVVCWVGDIELLARDEIEVFVTNGCYHVSFNWDDFTNSADADVLLEAGELRLAWVGRLPQGMSAYEYNSALRWAQGRLPAAGLIRRATS